MPVAYTHTLRLIRHNTHKTQTFHKLQIQFDKLFRPLYFLYFRCFREGYSNTTVNFTPFSLWCFPKGPGRRMFWDNGRFCRNRLDLEGNIMIQNEVTEGDGSGEGNNLTDYRGNMKYYQSKQCIMIFR